MIKVPATRAGVRAVAELTRAGININVTLLFSLERYEEVIAAYIRGLTARVGAGDGVSSAASFFLARVDAVVDARLPENSPLRGQVAVACARAAYQRYLRKFSSPAWELLELRGARRQRPL